MHKQDFNNGYSRLRELKLNVSQIIRMVRESGREVCVTHHGKVVVYLIPVRMPQKKEDDERSWATLDTLAVKIGASWPEGLSATQAISGARR